LKQGLCIICGNTAQLTRDHLPQRSLYPKAIRSKIKNMNIVQACEPCNNGAKLEDELFKVIIGMVATPEWNDELKNSVYSTLDSNQKLLKLINENSELESIDNPSNQVNMVNRVTLNSEMKSDFLSAIERCVKGFYFQFFDCVLVINKALHIIHPIALYPKQKTEIFEKAKISNWKSINSDTCRYTFLNMKNSDIIFIMNLYGSIDFYYLIRDINLNKQ
jgi:hypothetical protein